MNNFTNKNILHIKSKILSQTLSLKYVYIFLSILERGGGSGGKL